MTGKTTVVTPRRFAEGFSYQEYLSQIKVNKLRFQQYYDEFELDEGSLNGFALLPNAVEAPPRCWRWAKTGAPTSIGGCLPWPSWPTAPELEVRVFPRDSNLDVMNEFLKEGKYQSIPVFVFYTEGLDYICHWIERPEVADRESEEIERPFAGKIPTWTTGSSELSDARG